VFDIRRLLAGAGARRRSPPELDAGLRALEAGRYEEALGRFAAFLEMAPPAAMRALAFNKRGVALVALERRGQAREAFAEALVAVERYAPALVNIGNLLFEEGAVEEAIEHYRAALRAEDDYPGAHLNLGVALKRLGRTAEGVRHLRKAQRLAGRRRS
jgi:tetratricopeptide (TPR) repeat protein